MTLLETTLIAILCLMLGYGAGYVLCRVEQRGHANRPTLHQMRLWRRLTHAGGQREWAIRGIDQMIHQGNTSKALSLVNGAIRAHMFIERIMRDGQDAELTDLDLLIAESIKDDWIRSAKFYPFGNGMRLIRMLPELHADGVWRWWTPPEYVKVLARQEEEQHTD